MLKLLAVVILYFLSGMAWASEITPADYPVHKDWMKKLDDAALITKISIPGTHDSAADHDHCNENYNCSEVIEFASTQTYAINDQLLMGIRFFDIRLAYEKEKGVERLRFHHGPYYLEQHFSDAIGWAQDFLGKNPSEFVIFLIKQEHTSVSANTFWEKITGAFNQYPQDLFYLEKRVPTIGEARGKIIIMAREKADYPQGYHVEWPGNTTYYEGGDHDLIYVVEDHYSLKTVKTSTKFLDIRHNLALARLCMGSGDPNTLFITFLSGEGDPFHTPGHYADYENPNTYDWLVNHAVRGPRSGIIAMDYAGDTKHAGAELLKAVIGQNHPHKVSGWFGDNNAGGGISAADINGNGKPDLIVFDIYSPEGANGASYRIGWDMDSDGVPSHWLGPQPIPWQGHYQQGGGVAVADINGNGKPELIVFMIDDASGENHGYYRIGWDMDSHGILDKEKGENGWTAFVEVPSGVGWFGDNNAGGGLAVADINGKGGPELILFDIWNPETEDANHAHYRIGWDLDKDGTPSWWLGPQPIPWQGNDQQGGGITATDMNHDGTPDLIVFMIDNPQGQNHGYYRIGYMDKSKKVVTEWTDFKLIPDWFGDNNAGGGISAADINGNGKLDLIVFMIDNPSGENHGYYRVLWDVQGE